MNYAELVPCVVAVLSLLGLVLKHLDHSRLSALIEEALVLEHEREEGVTASELLRQACDSEAAHLALDAIVDRVHARVASNPVALPVLPAPAAETKP